MPSKIISPCMGICDLDDNNVCIGCLRTQEEVGAWTAMDNNARLELLGVLKQRRINAGRIGSRDLTPRRRKEMQKTAQ